jgi:hypothetical protein
MRRSPRKDLPKMQGIDLARERAMTLQQFQSLRRWHLRHWHNKPVETHIWDAVVTLWMTGWVAGPAGLLLQIEWAWTGSCALLFLPGLYVALRDRMHRRGTLRCDWIIVLR